MSDEISPELQEEIEFLIANPPDEEDQKRLDALLEKNEPRTRTFGKNAGAPKVTRNARLSFRVSDDIDRNMRYWSDKHEMSKTDYVIEAITEKIARENGDYDLPTLEQRRLNEITDRMNTLTNQVFNLEKSLTAGIEQLVLLAREPTYMVDAVRSIDDEQ